MYSLLPIKNDVGADAATNRQAIYIERGLSQSITEYQVVLVRETKG